MMAVLAAMLKFNYLVDGFTNRQLVDITSQLINEDYTSRQATYDLRRLKRKGLILKLPRKKRYQLTPLKTGRGAVHQELHPGTCAGTDRA